MFANVVGDLCFPNAVWHSASGPSRIVSDILVVIIRQMYIPGRTESDVVQEI